MRKIVPILLVLIVLASLLPVLSDARGLVPCGGCKVDFVNNQCPAGQQEPACGFCDTFKLINNIVIFFLVPSPSVNNMVAIVPLIATLLILVGGFYILIAAGRPTLQNKGKDILTAVAIGLLVVYIAWVAVMSILSFLGVAPWTGLLQWWDIKCGP